MTRTRMIDLSASISIERNANITKVKFYTIKQISNNWLRGGKAVWSQAESTRDKG